MATASFWPGCVSPCCCVVESYTYTCVKKSDQKNFLLIRNANFAGVTVAYVMIFAQALIDVIMFLTCGYMYSEKVTKE